MEATAAAHLRPIRDGAAVPLPFCAWRWRWLDMKASTPDTARDGWCRFPDSSRDNTISTQAWSVGSSLSIMLDTHSSSSRDPLLSVSRRWNMLMTLPRFFLRSHLGPRRTARVSSATEVKCTQANKEPRHTKQHGHIPLAATRLYCPAPLSYRTPFHHRRHPPSCTRTPPPPPPPPPPHAHTHVEHVSTVVHNMPPRTSFSRTGRAGVVSPLAAVVHVPLQQLDPRFPSPWSLSLCCVSVPNPSATTSVCVRAHTQRGTRTANTTSTSVSTCSQSSHTVGPSPLPQPRTPIQEQNDAFCVPVSSDTHSSWSIC